MKSIDTLENGIGDPDWRLALCLLLAWIVICAIMMKGVNQLCLKHLSEYVLDISKVSDPHCV